MQHLSSRESLLAWGFRPVIPTCSLKSCPIHTIFQTPLKTSTMAEISSRKEPEMKPGIFASAIFKDQTRLCPIRIALTGCLLQFELIIISKQKIRDLKAPKTIIPSLTHSRTQYLEKANFRLGFLPASAAHTVSCSYLPQALAFGRKWPF